MKLMATTAMVVGLVFLWSYCSYSSRNTSNALSNTSGVGQKRTSDIDVKVDPELHTQYLAMEKELRRSARKLGLKNLSDSRDTPEEIRIWFGFGIILPTSLVLTRLRNASQATFVAPKLGVGKAELDSKGHVIYAKNILGSPKSGWEELHAFLKEQGIGSPMRLAPERHFTIDPDETFLVIEARSGADYSMVFFPADDEETDAKKALGACRRLEAEFGVRIGCGDSASTQ